MGYTKPLAFKPFSDSPSVEAAISPYNFIRPLDNRFYRFQVYRGQHEALRTWSGGQVSFWQHLKKGNAPRTSIRRPGSRCR